MQENKTNKVDKSYTKWLKKWNQLCEKQQQQKKEKIKQQGD